MNEFTPSSSTNSPALPAGSWPARLVARYYEDHRHPVNHVLHVGVGWPLAAVAVILVPFHPFWSLGLFALAYAVMFSGHFIFERNVPTVLKHPATPFVIAGSVIRGLWRGLTRRLTFQRAQYDELRSELMVCTPRSKTTELH
jgi:hypothetical protein